MRQNHNKLKIQHSNIRPLELARNPNNIDLLHLIRKLSEVDNGADAKIVGRRDEDMIRQLGTAAESGKNSLVVLGMLHLRNIYNSIKDPSDYFWEDDIRTRV